ncbi:S-fimbrial adhesin protein SfaS precursor [Serratia grimesii]|uniref:fimbrial protein n=1 Tax=Serratia grimesii TaxID=82995 RepID=UPI001F4C0A09|nr:fimbrial protein [Serratia grimesii]CAI2793934.1 S-fimbrial adhesin protein SfaS precursor [Serratia grimesii]
MPAGVHAAGTDTATITITGTVKNPTCTLTDKAPAIVMDAVDVSDFGATANTDAGAKTVELKLTNCTDITALGIKVSGTAASGSNDVFANSETGDAAAVGVGFRLYDTDGVTAFTPDGNTKAATPTQSDNGYDIKYTAKYTSTSDTVTSGKVKSVITVTFSYS